MNKAVLIGRLTKDPEVKQTQSGIDVASFTLAVDRTFSKEKEADFINIVAWRKTAELCGKYLSKGSLVGISGRIQTRNYENKDKVKVYVTEIVADEVQFLDSRKKKEDLLDGFTEFDEGFENLDVPFV